MPLKSLDYGYYLFLGNGDYNQPKELAANWTSTWDKSQWKNFIDHISELGSNTLIIYLNGHSLPFKSQQYPELSDENHPNYKNDFFSEIIEYSSLKGISLIASLSTTGHAGKYSASHPELSISPMISNVDLCSLLTPFPLHIRERKNIAQHGMAQTGFGTLCHNNPQARNFSISLINEIIRKYSLEKIVLHPPESIYPCECKHCCDQYRAIYGGELKNLNYTKAMEFFFLSYINFQSFILVPEIRVNFPSIEILTFTVPWIYERISESIIDLIPKDIALIEWDYNLDLNRIESLGGRISKYRGKNHKLWFMPTAGFGIKDNHDDCLRLIQTQMNNAIDAGASGIIHFVGPCFLLNSLTSSHP